MEITGLLAAGACVIEGDEEETLVHLLSHANPDRVTVTLRSTDGKTWVRLLDVGFIEVLPSMNAALNALVYTWVSAEANLLDM